MTGTPETPTTRGPSILLVEDEELNRILIREILVRAKDPTIHSARLFEADSLRQARATLAEHSVDIVLLDIRLPDGSGLELARELTALGDGRRPAIIAITAGVLPEQREAAITAGCDAILTKPYSFSKLLSLLSSYLSRPNRSEDDRP